MKMVSNLGLAAALVIGGMSVAGASAASAKSKDEQAAKSGATYSAAERNALAPLQKAITEKNWEAAKAALPAAQAAAQGPDAKYALGNFMLNIGIGTNDEAMQSQALDTMIDSGKVPAAELPKFYQNQAIFATKAKNNAKAEAAFAKVLELTPNDPNAMINLAKAKIDLNKQNEALPLLQRAIAAQTAAGQKADENLYRYSLRLAYEAKNMPEALRISRALMTAYPSPQNWQTTLAIYQRSSTLDKSAQLDLLRLMRASKSFTQAGEYLELAQQLDVAGLPGEAKAVLDEGVASGKLTKTQPGYVELMRTIGPRYQGDRASLAAEEGKATSGPSGTLALKLADAYSGYGDYAKAVTLYRAALQKGGVDANLVNTHLGIALAQSGDRAGAEAAFKAVTGPRAELAGLWMAWLSQRA